MRKVKLTRNEQWIEDHFDEFVPVSREKAAEIVSALQARKKNAVLNIRVNKYDLEVIKNKARKMGVKYQTYISEFLHKLAQA